MSGSIPDGSHTFSDFRNDQYIYKYTHQNTKKMPLAYTIDYTLIFGSIFLMFTQWYLNIFGSPLTPPESMTLL